jgi:hypothetical protein
LSKITQSQPPGIKTIYRYLVDLYIIVLMVPFSSREAVQSHIEKTYANDQVTNPPPMGRVV